MACILLVIYIFFMVGKDDPWRTLVVLFEGSTINS